MPNVQIDDWVTVTFEKNWFPSVVFNVESINSFHSILSITLLTYLIGIDPSLKLVSIGEKAVRDEGGRELD